MEFDLSRANSEKFRYLGPLLATLEYFENINKSFSSYVIKSPKILIFLRYQNIFPLANTFSWKGIYNENKMYNENFRRSGS